nr:MAG TPA: Ubiquitin thioesterase otubain-like protein [Caudoviricetes sp.]DAQ34143.1 MAG TPA: Ubiquitin thioesterase otubain-like protein [Caudoviricetes sp.]DAS59009.1 MAG TPA: Ubiquitin thioesterase otubain-like protein [Caudoviricetes sp.]
MLDKGDKYEKENWFSCGNYFYRGFSFWYFKGSSKP